MADVVIEFGTGREVIAGISAGESGGAHQRHAVFPSRQLPGAASRCVLGKLTL